jgi:hypothetical protein
LKKLVAQLDGRVFTLTKKEQVWTISSVGETLLHPDTLNCITSDEPILGDVLPICTTEKEGECCKTCSIS